VTIIGAPDDRGVLNVGGRMGASSGPKVIKAGIEKFMMGIDGAIENVCLDRGFDIEPGATIEEGHTALRVAVAKCVRQNAIPVVLGGGHDYGFPHLAGVADAIKRPIAVINVDAHLDVQPPEENGITSGSPFYLALETGAVRPGNFVEFGIQEYCNDMKFRDYLKNKKVKIITLDEARRSTGGITAAFKKLISEFTKRKFRIVVNFDIDSIQMCQAPGVSSPSVDGFTAAEIFDMARFCGQSKNVASIGFFEFAPYLDINQQTERLVCTALHCYLSGLGNLFV